MKVEICTKIGRVNNLQLTYEAEILCNISFYKLQSFDIM